MPLRVRSHLRRLLPYWPLLVALALVTVLLPLLLIGMASGGLGDHRPQPRTMVYWAAAFLAIFAFSVGTRYAAGIPVCTGRSFLAKLGMALTIVTPTAAHTYSQVGTYQVWVTVTDTNGLSDPATQQVSRIGRPAQPIRVWTTHRRPTGALRPPWLTPSL